MSKAKPVAALGGLKRLNDHVGLDYLDPLIEAAYGD